MSLHFILHSWIPSGKTLYILPCIYYNFHVNILLTHKTQFHLIHCRLCLHNSSMDPFFVCFSIFLNFFLLLFKYSCIHFPPQCSSPLHWPPPSTLNPAPLWFCPWVLCTCSLTSLPRLSPVIHFLLPLSLLSVCFYFNVSGYILLACLFWLSCT